MITYNGLCKKLGFDIRDYFAGKSPANRKSEGPATEDDSKPSVFSVLSYEELRWIDENVLSAKSQTE